MLSHERRCGTVSQPFSDCGTFLNFFEICDAFRPCFLIFSPKIRCPLKKGLHHVSGSDFQIFISKIRCFVKNVVLAEALSWIVPIFTAHLNYNSGFSSPK